MRWTGIRGLVALAATCLAAAWQPAATAADAPQEAAVTVYAAASLTNVLQAVGAEYTRASGVPVKFSFAASSVLARQIEVGAPADVFVSADREWMDYLEQRGAIAAATRANVLGNRLALIAPADSRVELAIAPHFALGRALGSGRLATGDPDTVPAGRYARAALTALGVWSAVEDRLVRADDVRAALAFVARGEAPLGIVYFTDARADRRVRIVGLFPEGTHPPIVYPVALTKSARPAAAGLVAFLRSPAARAAYERAGFAALP